MAEPVKVRVKHGWTVYDGKTQRTGGDVLTVSADQAADWETAGWVEKVTAAKTRRASGSLRDALPVQRTGLLPRSR